MDNVKFAFDLLKKYQPRKINDLSLVNASLRPSGESYRDRLLSGEINKNPSVRINELNPHRKAQKITKQLEFSASQKNYY